MQACNLLNNAAKYQNDRRRIELIASAQSGAAVMRVRDDGVGIPPEMIDRIFERFVEIGSSQHRNQGGLGIGLSLVEAVVQWHGGSVQARSGGVGRGSEFIVTLPVATPVYSHSETVYPNQRASFRGRLDHRFCPALP